MALFFSFFVAAGIFFGWCLPHVGASLLFLNLPLLSLLMLIAGWNFPLKIWSKINWRDALLFHFLNLFVFPAIQFVLAWVLISDEQIRWGFYFSSILPIGIVIPHYVERWNEDATLSFQGMFLSIVTFPLMMAAIWYFFRPPFFLELRSLSLNLVCMAILPYLIAVGIRSIFRMPPIPARFLTIVNPILIGILVWILLGASQNKILWQTISKEDIWGGVLVAAAQNFLPLAFYFILKQKSTIYSAIRTACLSGSIRNNALGAGFLFFFHPRAALPVLSVFFAHAILFIILSFRSKNTT